MKKLKNLILTICFLLLLSNISFAQQKKGNSNNEKAKTEKQVNKGKKKNAEAKEKGGKELAKKHDMGKQNHDFDEKEQKETGVDGKGNAYGKNKNGIEGKEFGQERARQAKLNKEEKSKELDNSMSQGESRIKEGKEKIKKSKEKLEKEKKEGAISDKDYKNQKDKINKAEKGIEDLEEKIEKGKKVKTNNKKE